MLSLYPAKSKRRPECFSLGTIGMENNLAIESPCMVQHVESDTAADPAPAVQRQNIEAPHAQPTAVDEILRDSANADRITSNARRRQNLAGPVKAIRAVTPLILKDRQGVKALGSGRTMQSFKAVWQPGDPPNHDSIKAGHDLNSPSQNICKRYT